MLFSLISQPIFLLPVLAALIIAFTFHEFCHALVATWLGDPTPENAGRLTLNPLKHMDPLGFLLLITVGFGFGKPVPFDDRYLKNPKWGAALIGAAGPLANLFLTAVAFAAIVISGRMGIPEDSILLAFLLFLMQFNVVLMLFNVIPVPPLDGSKVLFALMPPRYDNVRNWLESNGPWVLLVLVLLDAFSPISIFGNLFFGVFNFLTTLASRFIG